MFHILVIDDDEQMQFYLREALQQQGYDVSQRTSAEEGLDALRSDSSDLVLMDVRLPGMDGLMAVEEILQIDPRIPVILMTAHGTLDVAIEAMRRGAYDYFTKPFRLEEMEIVIRRALEKRRLFMEIERLREELSSVPGRRQALGRSRAMAEVSHLVERAAPTDSTVLILGESGVGKELVAERIHELSSRKLRPFVKLNCAAIPETLLESELFGYERGAFTGAQNRKPGKFELADLGTLLLDEIGDMTLATQAKILRVLQNREVERVGGTATIRVDVRIIASTNKDLPRRVREGLFRDDLYFRLNVITIERSAPPGAEGGDRRPGRPVPGRSQQAARPHDSPGVVRRDGGADGLRLAREHPRAEERHRAGRGGHRRRGRDPGLPASPRPPGRGRPGGRCGVAAVGGAGGGVPGRQDDPARARVRHRGAVTHGRRAGGRGAPARRHRAQHLAPRQEAPDRGRQDQGAGAVLTRRERGVMIGQILVTNQVITQEQLELALQEQRASGALLGDVLISLKMASEEALTRALAQEARVPYAAPETLAPDPDAAALVPEALARRHLVAPVSRTASGVRLAQANPFDVLAVDDLQRATGLPVELVCTTRTAVLDLLARTYGANSQLRGLVDEAVVALSQPHVDVAASDSPVVRLIETMIGDAVRAGATDLHIEPEERLVRLRHRVDGVLVQADTLPRELLPAVVSRLKVMAGLDIAEQRLPQEGRITHGVAGRTVDMRVSCFPTVHGEKVAIRILEKERLVRPLEDLGLSKRNLVVFHDLLSKSRGIILVTGPTGSGKTTTLYSALNYLGGREKNIMTVEDPVEYEFSSIRQTQVRPRAGLTFATAIRSLLRQDPDVIMVGEIRDPETAELAVRAALSGVLVFTTLHTQDSAGAIPRLMDMGIEPYLLASALVGVAAQRLLRLLCPYCREPATYGEDVLAKVNLSVEDPVVFYRGRGCPRCSQTGYRGRTGVFELLAVDPAIHDLIRQRADSRRIKEAAVRGGLKTLLDDALSKAIFGQTSLDEVLRVAYE